MPAALRWRSAIHYTSSKCVFAFVSRLVSTLERVHSYGHSEIARAGSSSIREGLLRVSVTDCVLSKPAAKAASVGWPGGRLSPQAAHARGKSWSFNAA